LSDRGCLYQEVTIELKRDRRSSPLTGEIETIESIDGNWLI
jgi:hypothetical protein